MRSMLNRKRSLCGLAVAALAAAACVPGVGTAVGGVCAACTVFDSKAAAPTAARAASASSRAVDAVALAADLASYGYRANSALSLLTAAELLMQASPSALTGKQGGRTTVATKSGPSFNFEPGAMISSALSMGGGNANVSALASQLQARLASGPKGAVGGPRSTTDRVLANTTDIWQVNFRGGERGSIRVDGDGDTDLDCYVYNSAGTMVAYDNDYTDYCILDWYQSYTGTVRLEIRNLGDVYNQYVLTTN